MKKEEKTTKSIKNKKTNLKVPNKKQPNRTKDLKKINKDLEKQVKNLTEIILNIKISQEKNKLELQNNEIVFKKLVNETQKKANLKVKEHKLENEKKLSVEIDRVKKYGAKKLLTAIIDPLANLTIAINFGINSDDQHVKNYVSGFKMIMDQLDFALKNEGIQKINPKIGTEFNPKFHHVVHTEENEEMKNKIITVKKQGYILHDLVVEPAIVVIGK